MKIKISQTWSKIVKTWSTACDFLTGDQARTDFYRWLSRKLYGRETRVIKTRGGDRLVTSCEKCPMGRKLYAEFECRNLEILTSTNKRNIDIDCELHFRLPVFFQILPVILAYIGTLAIILTACPLYWKYK